MQSVVLEKRWWRLRATHLRGLGLVVAFVVVAPIGALLALLLRLLGGSLSLATGGELEVEVVALEVEATAELVVHVDILDVGLGEGLHGGDGVALAVGAGQSALAGDGGGEAAQVAQHLVMEGVKRPRSPSITALPSVMASLMQWHMSVMTPTMVPLL